MARKKTEDAPPPGSPAWMTTYGDMVTLVLTFFVLLYSFSSMDSGKWQELVGALSGTMGVLDGSPVSIIDESSLSPNTDVSPPSDIEEDELTEEELRNNELFDELYGQISDAVEEQGMGGQLELSRTDAEIIIRFSDNALFDSGKADLREETLPMFDSLAGILSSSYDSFDMLRVEGHTDNLPINTPEFPNNRWLSLTRAYNVASYLLDELEFDPVKLSYMGYGEHRPIADNETDEGRAQNRRVELIVVKKSIERDKNVIDIEDYE